MHQEFQAVILAAGKGSRMPEITAEKPKCLLPVGSKPLVWYPLYKLQQSGFKDVIMIVIESQRSEIQTSLDKADLDIKIDYVGIPNNDEMGTADSLRYIQDKIRSDLIIMSCDLITDINFGELVHQFRKNEASLCSLYFNPQIGNVTVPGPKTKHKPERDLIGIDAQTNRLVFSASASDFEKDVTLTRMLIRKHTNLMIHSNLIDAHLYIVKNWVVKYLQHEENISTIKGEFLPHLIKKQMCKPPVKKTDTNTSIVNVKESSDIFQFLQHNQLKENIIEASSFTDHFGDLKGSYNGDLIRCYACIAAGNNFGVRINTLPAYWSINSKIVELWERITQNKPLITTDPKSEIKSNQIEKCYIWEGAVLNEKTSFKNSIIGANTTVNSFSRVFNSIVMNNVEIKEKVAIENCIVCDGAVIENNCTLKNCLVGSSHVVLSGSQHVSEELTDSERLMEF